MTAVALFDAITARRSDGGLGKAEQGTASRLAEQLIEAELADLARIEEYEKEFGSPELHDENADAILRSVYELFAQWANDAEEVLSRARLAGGMGQLTAKIESLADACGRVRARLGLTPEKMVRALRQARAGDVVPGEIIRDELRARLHR